MEEHLGGGNLNGYITSHSSGITKTRSEVTQPTQRHACHCWDSWKQKCISWWVLCTALLASLNQMIGEMHKRFDKLNLSLMKATQALSPWPTVFLDYRTLIPFLSHYDLPSHGVKVELLTVDTMLHRCRLDGVTLKNLHDVYQQLSTLPWGFPVPLRCQKIAMTFGITSATADMILFFPEKSTNLPSLYNLSFLYIEKDLSSTLWDCLDEAVQSIAAQHRNSRIVVIIKMWAYCTLYCKVEVWCVAGGH